MLDLTGVEFLETVLSSQFPEAFVPTPSQFNIIFTLISNPLFSGSRKIRKKAKLTSDSLSLAALDTKFRPDPSLVHTPIASTATRVLQKVLSTRLPIKELKLHEVFNIDRTGVREARASRRPRQVEAVKYVESIETDDDENGEYRPPGASRKKNSRLKEMTYSDSFAMPDESDSIFRAKGLRTLWESAEQDFFRILGWGLKCSSACADVQNGAPSSGEDDFAKTLESRWPTYCNLLTIILEILETDWNEAVKEFTGELRLILAIILC